MALLPSLRISQKLPLALVGSAIVVSAGVGIASYLLASQTIEREARQNLETIAVERANQLSAKLQSIETDLVKTGTTDATVKALAAFNSSWQQAVTNNAVDELRKTYTTDNPNPPDQRLLLEARAQSDIGRRDLALDIISNLTGREAIRLRSDIYWAARRWRESAEQIELLYGDRWRDFKPLTDTEKSDIIRAAIGYALANDAIGLARFREKYAPKMDSASDRSAFAIASKPASADSADFARIARMAAAIDTLDGFLREMRLRFPDAVARVKPAAGVDTETTGALPAIVGTKQVKAER